MGSSIVNSSAENGGCIILGTGQIFMTYNSTLVNCYALSNGGAMDVSGGSTTISHNSSIINSSAGVAGGAISLRGGIFLVTSTSSVVGSYCSNSGGAFALNGGLLKITGASLITNSRAGSTGGAMTLLGGEVVIDNSTIHTSVSNSLGGAFLVRGGSLLVTNGSAVINSSSEQGGGIAIYGGVVTLANHSTLLNSSSTLLGGAVVIGVGEIHVLSASLVGSTTAGKGGAIFIIGGFFNLIQSTISSSTATSGSILYFDPPADAESNGLFLATNSEFKQQQCTSVFAFAQSMQVVLRNVQFTPLAGCDQDLLVSNAFGSKTSLLKTACGSTFVNPATRISHDVCTPHAVCSPQPVNGTLLMGVTCQCVEPDYPNPDLDFADAPYSLGAGCIRPWRMNDVFTISREVAISLHKPFTWSRELNLTLEMEGDRGAAASYWSLNNLTDTSSWLELPVQSGEAVQEQINIQLKFSSRGVGESATPYSATLVLSVSSSISALNREHLVRVSLVVQAETSFLVWGHVPSGALCPQGSKSILGRLNCTVDVPLEVRFTACDTDQLPVNHHLPTQLNPVRPIVLLSAFGRGELRMILPSEYINDGVYKSSPRLPTHGPFELALDLNGSINALAGQSFCPVGFVALPSGRCGCASGLFQLSAEEPCQPCRNEGTSSFEGAIGEENCNICQKGYYRSLSSMCLECPVGAICPLNTSLHTMQVDVGYWRLAPTAPTLYKCDTWLDASGSQFSACAGGAAGSSTCAAGHSGPLCKLCTNQSEYYDDRCKECPESTAAATSIVLITVFMAALLASLRWLHNYRGLKCALLASSFRLLVYHIKAYVDGMGFFAKFKLLLVFSQIISALEDTFGIGLPESWYKWTGMFSLIGKIDWTEWFVPAACVIGPQMKKRLIIEGLCPFALICGLPVLGALFSTLLMKAGLKKHASAGVAATKGALAWLPSSLFIAFCFTPSVTIRAFRAWNCVGFAINDSEERFFLEGDLAVSCEGSDEYASVITVAWVLIAIWPVGMVLSYAAFLLPCHQMLYHEKSSSAYVRATAFLHRDYKTEFFWWEVLSLVERTLLTGWLCIIDRKVRILRLTSAIVICSGYLAALLVCRPYKHKLDGILAAVGQLLLVSIFSSGMTVLQYERIANDPAGSSELAQRFVGLPSSDEAVVVLIVVALSNLLFFMGSMFAESHSRYMTKQLENKWSLCTIAPPRVKAWKPLRIFACFISHFKLEAGSDARYLHDMLRRMLRAPVFIDSVMLNDLRKLISEGVHQSDVLLLLATKGVLTRPWCLIELLETVRQKIPVVIVQMAGHEFNINDARRYVGHFKEEMARVNPSGLEFLLQRLHGDLSELEKALLHILDDNEHHLMSFSSHVSDYTLVAMLQDIVERMARKTNRSIEWERDKKLRHPFAKILQRPRLKVIFSKSALAQNSSRRLTRGAVAVFISCARNDGSISEARVLRAAICTKLDRNCVIGGRDGSLKHLSLCHLLVVILTKSFMSDPDALAEVYIACTKSIPLVTLVLAGSGYDFAEAAQFYQCLPIKLAQKHPDAVSSLMNQLPDGTDLTTVGTTIHHHLSSIIALPWAPNSSSHHLDAIVSQIVTRMPRRRGTLSNSPTPRNGLQEGSGPWSGRARQEEENELSQRAKISVQAHPLGQKSASQQDQEALKPRLFSREAIPRPACPRVLSSGTFSRSRSHSPLLRGVGHDQNSWRKRSVANEQSEEPCREDEVESSRKPVMPLTTAHLCQHHFCQDQEAVSVQPWSIDMDPGRSCQDPPHVCSMCNSHSASPLINGAFKSEASMLSRLNTHGPVLEFSQFDLFVDSKGPTEPHINTIQYV